MSQPRLYILYACLSHSWSLPRSIYLDTYSTLHSPISVHSLLLVYKDPEINWQDPETFFCTHTVTVHGSILLILDRVLSISSSESNDITIIMMLSAEWTVTLLFTPRACARGKAIGLSVCCRRCRCHCRCRHENRQISHSRHLCVL